MDISDLVNLTSRAWALPILGALAGGTPGRKAALVAATGAGRTAFSHSLEHLLSLALLERNPGHGHPLRPEFRLTAQGQVAARMAADIQALAGSAQGADVLRKAWTLPILAATQQPSYFTEIKAILPPVTDRALSMALQQLQGHAWIDRQVALDLRPPRPRYAAVDIGAEIGQIAALAA